MGRHSINHQPDASIAPPGGPVDPGTPGAPDIPAVPEAPPAFPGTPEPSPGSPEITPSEPAPFAPDENSAEAPAPTWHAAGGQVL